MQKCNIRKLKTFVEIWWYNRIVKINAQNITENISIFYDNSSWNIITLRSFSFIQF